MEDTHSPSLLKNIDEALDMVTNAIRQKLKITVFLDADGDGIKSGAIAYRFLTNFTSNIELIHVQRDSGHGLHLIEDKIPEDTELLIVVDSSTSESDACQRVSEKGIPILILDHHPVENSNTYATIVNPQQHDCNYPNLDMSGALVTWKVCRALDEYYSTDYTDDLVDLAGFSLLTDSMSVLEPENRYFIKQALGNVQNLGLNILFDELKKDKSKLNATDFSFSVSPCITAATRMNKLEIALQLLISDDEVECRKIAKQLIEANDQRKKIQLDSISLVKDQINPNDKVIIVLEPSIGKSFNGVVATEIAQTYQRPAIVLGESQDKPDRYSGSYRTYGDFDMKSFLKTVKSSIFAAGHSGAGGSACFKNKLEDFKREVNYRLKDEKFEQEITYELELDAGEIKASLIQQIEQFYRITGRDFQQGKFLIKNLFVSDKNPLSKKFTNYEHIKISVDNLDVIKFKTNEEYFNNIPVFKAIDAVGSLKINEYERYDRNKGGKVLERSNQMLLEEYRLAL